MADIIGKNLLSERMAKQAAAIEPQMLLRPILKTDGADCPQWKKVHFGYATGRNMCVQYINVCVCYVRIIETNKCFMWLPKPVK
jgi:hypothetical protein